MPRYRVELVERHDQTIEEIYRSFQEAFLTRVIEVEAEDEDEAHDLALDGEGDIIDEDWSYGDIYDSEFWESGELIDSEYRETDVESIDEVTAYEIEQAELRRQAAIIAERARAQWGTQYSWTVKPKPKTPSLSEPEWEV